jgi:hypothetical protein
MIMLTVYRTALSSTSRPLLHTRLPLPPTPTTSTALSSRLKSAARAQDRTSAEAFHAAIPGDVAVTLVGKLLAVDSSHVVGAELLEVEGLLRRHERNDHGHTRILFHSIS